MRASSRSLDGLEIAITGKLASMTREEAVAAIGRVGARYVETPRDTTQVLVVGIEGWPLQKDGKPTRSLERAKELSDLGHAIRVVDEATFLLEAGLPERADELASLYTIEQLARVLQVPIGRLRDWIRRRLIEPVRVVRRLCYFDFAQVASAKALQQLLDSGAGLGEIERSLRQLDGWLPGARAALVQIAAASQSGDLLVPLEDGKLAEPTGQLRFAFAEEGETGAATHGLHLHRREPSAEQWFDRGVTAEADGRLEEAADHYHEALLAGGPRAEAAFNLGNVLHALGRSAEAAQRYMNAVEIDAHFAEAWNNLGNALAELGRFEPSVRAYRRAVALLPDYADAHFNLAETLHQISRFAEARVHWSAYLERSPHSKDRAFVRRRISECDAALTRGRRSEPPSSGRSGGG
ncbi:MAG: tetratricopeptide repeat protein [Planctomycetota bacterium]